MAPSRRELRGPKPPPLTVNKDSWKVKKLAPAAVPSSGAAAAGRRNNPVVVYVRTPKIIHTSPQEFMSLVQSLTGKKGSPASSSSPRSNGSRSSGVTHVEDINGAVQPDGCGEEGGRCSSSSSSGGSGGEVDVDPLLLTLGQVPFTPSDPPAISPSFLFCSPTTERLLQEFSTLF